MKKIIQLFKKERQIPMINHYSFYEEGIWKADLYKFDKDKRYTIIDFKFNDDERYIKYYYK